eukprot:14398026-Ditylum_brightwellii.AAC.1
MPSTSTIPLTQNTHPCSPPPTLTPTTQPTPPHNPTKQVQFVSTSNSYKNLGNVKIPRTLKYTTKASCTAD